MTCPRCHGSNVSVQFVQDSAKTGTKGAGCLWGLGRAFLVICTCGLWLLVGKRKGTSKTQFNSEKRAVCQSCGHSWVVR